jgi:hypothetical protein
MFHVLIFHLKKFKVFKNYQFSVKLESSLNKMNKYLNFDRLHNNSIKITLDIS